MRRLHEIQITINGADVVHTATFDGKLAFVKDDMELHLHDAVELIYESIREYDFARLDGKRPEKCPICKQATQEAGKKELPPYRDWDCTLCSMNGYDGKFNVKE